MDFALFIGLNGLLLLRPEDLIPAITGLRLYLLTITACTAAALPKLSFVLTPPSLARRPVAVCVLGMLAAGFASFAYRGRVSDAFDHTAEFAKVVLYFFLLVSIVDTPARFRSFLGWVVLFVCGASGLALAHYFEVIVLPGLDPVMQTEYDPVTGEMFRMPRLISSGMFNDPNDLSVMVMTAIVLSVGLAVTAPSPMFKFFWLLPVAPLAYTSYLTHSRGGVLALLGGMVATFYGRFGFKRSIPLLLVAVPAILVSSGRGGNISSGGTAHERLMLWAYGLGDLFRMPFHIPTGLAPGHYVQEHSLVAHNSYISSYVELGVFGGGMFLAAFYYAFRQAFAAGRGEAAEEWAARLRPFVAGAVATYAVGCYSLTRNFTLPTYLALGIGAAFAHLAAPDTPAAFVVDGRWWRRLIVGAVAGLVVLKFSTQFLGQLGV